MFSIDTVTAMNVVRNVLRENLTDPYQTAGGNYRGGALYIFANEPSTHAKFPKIEIKKVDNPSVPIDINYNYMEYEQLFLNVWFYSKNGFKVTVSGIEYKNEQFVEYYLGQIKETLKAQSSTLHTSGAKMYKHMNTTPIGYDPDTQLYFGAVSIRISYFNR